MESNIVKQHSVIDHGLGFAFGCSRQGFMHTKSGKNCQDAFGIRSGSVSGKDWLAFAIADGHGDDRHDRSAIGSALAVEAALSEISMLLTGYINSPTPELIKKAFKEMLPRKVTRRWRELIKDYQSEMFSGEQVHEDIHVRYGSTLLIAACFDNDLILGGIGDGKFVLVRPSGEFVVIKEFDQLLIGNQTDSLCSKDSSLQWLTKRINLNEGGYLLMCTDGLANCFATDKGFNQFSAGVIKSIEEHGPHNVAGDLGRWLNTYSEKGSGDDISLVFAYLPPSIDLASVKTIDDQQLSVLTDGMDQPACLCNDRNGQAFTASEVENTVQRLDEVKSISEAQEVSDAIHQIPPFQD